LRLVASDKAIGHFDNLVSIIVLATIASHESPDWNQAFINIHKNSCDLKSSAKAVDINVLLVPQEAAVRKSDAEMMKKIDRLSARPRHDDFALWFPAGKRSAR